MGVGGELGAQEDAPHTSCTPHAGEGYSRSRRHATRSLDRRAWLTSILTHAVTLMARSDGGYYNQIVDRKYAIEATTERAIATPGASPRRKMQEASAATPKLQLKWCEKRWAHECSSLSERLR
jgi:hypothetical protein